MKQVNSKDGKFQSMEHIRVNDRIFSGESLYYVNKRKRVIEHQSVFSKGTFDGITAIKVDKPGMGVSTYILDAEEANLYVDYDEANKILDELKRLDALPKTKVIFDVPNELLESFHLKLHGDGSKMSRSEKIIELITDYARGVK